MRTRREHAALNSVRVPLYDFPHLNPAVANVAAHTVQIEISIYKVLSIIFQDVFDQVYDRNFDVMAEPNACARCQNLTSP